MYYVKESVKDIVRIRGRQDRLNFLRLDMNENPEGLPVEFVERLPGSSVVTAIVLYVVLMLVSLLVSAYGTAYKRLGRKLSYSQV